MTGLPLVFGADRNFSRLLVDAVEFGLDVSQVA